MIGEPNWEQELRELIDQMEEDRSREIQHQREQDLKDLRSLGESLRIQNNREKYQNWDLNISHGRGKHRTPRKTYFSK